MVDGERPEGFGHRGDRRKRNQLSGGRAAQPDLLELLRVVVELRECLHDRVVLVVGHIDRGEVTRCKSEVEGVFNLVGGYSIGGSAVS